MLPGQNERKRILVADDDPAIAELMKRVLSARFDVVTAYNGNDAIAVALRPPRPDLLLLDVMMPGLDGLSVAKHLKTVPELTKVPIIFVTARDNPMDVIRGIQMGARHYVTKPFKLNDLVLKVNKALGE